MREIEENKTYRHFKGNVYKVVIYKSNHDGKIWVRPYDNFISKVDKEKYPSAEQEYRFEMVD